ncbi:hypothetical protein LTR78_000110 [Recurvomyces mirabilis]|uniref:Uncharacterized protein n=1 Tax=Recurvomyces mirabilis TaxID=574656 RepID=A0AAE0WXF5_9PEZI|nr:hypothetical protein LTR78_000110 [Recurvomyces mirabilis]KAK5161767.1 hypothetical protein LTS14_000112 [Recurvomyces mirabilis]
MSLCLCPCDPRWYGVGDPIHNPMLAASYDYHGAQPAFVRAVPFFIEDEQLRAEMVSALYDVVDLVTQNAADQSDTYYTALNSLNGYVSALWYQSTLPVPLEVAAGLSWQDRYAATLAICIDLLIRSQLLFDAQPHSGVWRTIQDLDRQADSLLVTGDFAQPLSTVTAPEITSNAPPHEVVTSSSTQPQRPGLSILQPAESGVQSEPSGMKTMTEVPTISTTLTIGSGTDWIDHFDARHLQINGVETIKLLHPIQQASIAKHQAVLLQQLARKVSIGVMSKKYGPSTSVQHRAAKQTVDTVIGELRRRDAEVPHEAGQLQKLRTSGPGLVPIRASTYGFQPARQSSFAGEGPSSFRTQSKYGSGTHRQSSFTGNRISSLRRRGGSLQPTETGMTPSYPAHIGPRVSSFRQGSQIDRVPRTISTQGRGAGGTTPLLGGACGYGQHAGSQAGLSRSTLRAPSTNRRSSTTGQVTSDYTKEVCQLGTGQLYSEWMYSGSGLEVKINHPVSLSDLPGTLEEKLVPGMKRALVDRNAKITKTELEDLEVAKKFYARGETIKVFTTWLEGIDVAKSKVATQAMADFVTTADRDNVAERFLNQISGAGLSATESATIADRICGGEIDELVAEQVHKDKRSSFHAQGLEPRGKGRAVSFMADGASSTSLEDGLFRDAGIFGDLDTTDDRDAVTAVTERLGDDYIAAFPNASRVDTLEAAQKALAEQLSAACADVPPQSVPEDDFVDAPAHLDIKNSSASQPTMHEDLAQRAAASTDDVSDKAEAASDVGGLKESDGGATAGGAKAE